MHSKTLISIVVSLIISCATAKKNDEDSGQLIAPIPEVRLYNAANAIRRQILTKRILAISLVNNECLNEHQLSRYEIVIFETNKESSDREVFRKIIEKFEFNLQLEFYSDYSYFIELVDFNTRKSLAKKTILPGDQRVILSSICDKSR